MRYYFISGETSGDQHAAKVIGQLASLDTNAEFRGMGGDESQRAGLDLLVHQKEMAFMGFWEVLRNIRTVSKNLKRVKHDIEEWKPDAVVLIDYPGFNFKIARYAHEKGIAVHYYISPKVWAWKENRVKLIDRYVDHLYSILPFEVEFFAKRGIEAIYVGNPSKEAVDAFLQTAPAHDEETKTLALLPGSRAQEINSAFPIMLEVARQYDRKIVVAQAPGFDKAYYHQFGADFTLIPNDMYRLLANADIAMVTSGTATLETALMNVPQVVCYRMAALTYRIALLLVKLEYYSLANLVLGKAAIPELIQGEFNSVRLKEEVDKLLINSSERQTMLGEYQRLQSILGDVRPSHEVATRIYQVTS